MEKNGKKQSEQRPRPSIIHPSQDFTDALGFYTIPIRCPDPHGKSSPFKTKHLLIASDGKLFESDNAEGILESLNVFFGQKPYSLFPDRWTEEDINAFIVNPQDINVYAVYSKLVTCLEKYVELKDAGWYHILALWIMGTYVYQVFQTYPYLSLSGFKGSGKSKLAEVIARLAFNGLLTVNSSEASLFRIVESARCTFILDEGEQLRERQKNETLIQLLNSGYRKGSFVPRQEKTKDGVFETRTFDPYSPKVIVGINGLEEVLASRTISITMMRAKSDKGRKQLTDHGEDWVGIRAGLYRFGLRSFRDIRVHHDFVPETRIGNNRTNDLWSPLLATAHVVLKNKPEELIAIRSFAEEQIEKARFDTNVDEVTYAFILTLKTLAVRDCWLSNKDIFHGLKRRLDSPDEIKSATVGYTMKRLGLNERKRAADGVRYRVTPDDVTELMDRFDIENPSDPSQSPHPSKKEDSAAE